MKMFFLLAAVVLMSLVPIAAVNAGPDNVPTDQIPDRLDQDEQITPPKVGISWREQVMKERINMRRASEMRNANMRNALMGEQEKIEGVGVDAYNELILERNSGLEK